MNLIKQKIYFDKIKNQNINLNWIIFDTKENFERNMKLVSYFYIIDDLVFSEKDEKKLLLYLHEQIELLDKNDKKILLQYMIEKWFSWAYYFKTTFNIDLENIDKKFFIEWIKTAGIWLIFHPDLEEYLNLYSNPEELYLYILEEWYIETFFYLNKEYDKKIDDIILDNAIEKFKYNFKNIFEYEDKLFVIYNNDWNYIFNKISNNPDKHISKIREFVFLNEEEKQKLEEEKSSNKYYDNYNRKIKEIEDDNKKDNFYKIKSYDIDNNVSLEEYKSDLIRTINFSNKDDEFIIYFINLFWVHDFLIVALDKSLYEDEKFVFTKEEFFKEINSMHKNFVFNYKNSDIDFSVLVYKYRWDNNWGWWWKEFNKKIRIAA